MRSYFPVLCEWVERANGEGALNSRMYGEKLYSLDERGELVGRVATSDGGEWLEGDGVPETLLAVLEVFFEEMWPVLSDAAHVLTRYIASDAHEIGAELPGKTFTATPEFMAEQTGEGPLTHDFEIRGTGGRRMVVPYQIWMLQRVERAVAACTAGPGGREALETLLERFPRGAEILDLAGLMGGCRLRKQGARIFSEPV